MALAIQKSTFRGETIGGRCWPNQVTSAPSTVACPFCIRLFAAHASGVDMHHGADVNMTLGDPVYATMGGIVFRSRWTHFHWRVAAQLAEWAANNPGSTLSAAIGTNILALTCGRTGAATWPTVDRLDANTRVWAQGGDSFMMELKFDSVPSVTGEVGIALFSADGAEWVALGYDGSTLTVHGKSNGSTWATFDGVTSSVANITWLRIKQVAGTWSAQRSTDGDTWTNIATASGKTFASSAIPSYIASIYWRSGDTNASPYTINLAQTNFVDSVQDVGRNGCWARIANGSIAMSMFHMDYLAVRSGPVKAGQIIGYAGKTGVDDSSGRVDTVHSHFEECPLVGNAYSADTAVNPLTAYPLGFTDNNVTVNRTSNGTHQFFEVITARNSNQELIFNEIIVVGGVTRTLNLNTRAGMDPTDRDANNYQGVSWTPLTFTAASSAYTITFAYAIATIGTISSWTVKNARGVTVASGSGP